MTKNIIRIYYTILGILILLLFITCAKVGSPSGGPKDEKPPVIVKSKPVNYQKNFKGERFEITFNEYITIKDLTNELIISPPLKEKPTHKLRGKTFIFNLNNTLRDSITYTFNFGNSIVDFNEGNPLTNFEFVVTTGDYLDTLTLTGELVEAHNLQPLKDPVLVMMYANLNDSAPLREIPLYVGRTDKTGKFTINNIKTGTYRVFALRDVNRNMIYDHPEESIAFIDSSFVFDPAITNFKESIIIDTSLISEYVDSAMFTDSLMAKFVVDSLSGDTINIPQRISYALNVSLYLFAEETKIQYITIKERTEKGKVRLCFNRPQYDTVAIYPLNFKDSPGLILKETSKFNDTIVLWITDTTITNLDTLALRVAYTAPDSTHQLVIREDTLKLRYREAKSPPVAARRPHKDEPKEEKQEYLNLQLNVASNARIDLNRPITVLSEKPVENFNISLFSLYKIVDSVEHEVNLSLIADTSRLRRFVFDVKWEQETKYRLFIAPQAFTDIYGISNDTIDISFTTQVQDYYGTIILNIKDSNAPFLIQLIDSKDIVVRVSMAEHTEKVVFDYLGPGSYRIKAIHDINRNGKWDTGNYLAKRQPEKVYFYPEKIDLRSNWDLDLTWDIK